MDELKQRMDSILHRMDERNNKLESEINIMKKQAACISEKSQGLKNNSEVILKLARSISDGDPGDINKLAKAIVTQIELLLQEGKKKESGLMWVDKS